MAKYSKTADLTLAQSRAAASEYVRGASEAPRVHGTTSSHWGKLPRFKNQFFVGFAYSDLTNSPANLKENIELTYKVRTIDAPRFEIDTETLNQYNKSRILPMKINYQPINIIFWDDRSNLIKDFWDKNYKFYFKDSSGKSDLNYVQTVSDKIVDSKLGVAGGTEPAYDHFGYNMANKFERKNLYAYLSLYLTAGGNFFRTDIVNPFLQSMQNDNFSQESSGELAQITTTWGYEAIVYYDAGKIEDEPPLVAMLDNTIFNRVGNSPIVNQEIPKIRQVEPNIDNYDAFSGGRGAVETRATDAFGAFSGGRGLTQYRSVDALGAWSGGRGAREVRGVDDFTPTQQNSVLISPEEANIAIRQVTTRVAGPPPKSTAQQFADEGITAADILKVENTNTFTREQSFAGEGEGFSASPTAKSDNYLDQIQRQALNSTPAPVQNSAVATNLKQVKEDIAEKAQLKPDKDTKKAENSVDSHPSPSKAALESELEDANHKIEVNKKRLERGLKKIAELQEKGVFTGWLYAREYNRVYGPSGYKMKNVLLNDRGFAIEQKIAKL
jgi:hypothetical protein